MRDAATAGTAAAFGAPALELVNSARGAAGGDALDDDRWLAAALARWSLGRGAPLDAAERDGLRRLRDVLGALVDRVATGTTLSVDELAPLNRILARAPVRAELVAIAPRRYAVDMTPVAAGWLAVAERELAGSFGSLLVRSEPGRLRVCADADCRRAFYDTSRSGTRRWCDPRTCGNRVRVRRHRARVGEG